MKYLFPILTMGAGSLLISCGNGDSTLKTESVTQSNQDHSESAINTGAELAVQTDSTSEMTSEVEVAVEEEVGGISQKEAKQILSNYDPENEKFRLAELERRRNLALKADPTLKIPEPKQVIAQERKKYQQALEVQKMAKAAPAKLVEPEAKAQVVESNIKTVDNKPAAEEKPMKQAAVKVDPPVSKPQAKVAKPETTKTEVAKTVATKTVATKTETSKPETSKPALAKPKIDKQELANPEPEKTVVAQPKETKPELTQPVVTRPVVTPQPEQEATKTSSSGVAMINFDQMTFSFDTIVEGDIIDYQFKFVNTGTQTVEILNAKATCGCTRPSFPFLPIEPGQEGYIGVKYDSRTKSGNQTPTIDVITNFQDDPIKLYLKGYVKEKAKEEEVEK